MPFPILLKKDSCRPNKVSNVLGDTSWCTCHHHCWTNRKLLLTAQGEVKQQDGGLVLIIYGQNEFIFEQITIHLTLSKGQDIGTFNSTFSTVSEQEKGLPVEFCSMSTPKLLRFNTMTWTRYGDDQQSISLDNGAVISPWPVTLIEFVSSEPMFIGVTVVELWLLLLTCCATWGTRHP